MDENLATVLGAIELMKKKLGEARSALMAGDEDAIATAKNRLNDVKAWAAKGHTALKAIAPDLFEAEAA